MKKGFTLIEILAVILILGTILVIAIPQINELIDHSRTKAYINNEKMVTKAAETYMNTNFDKLPTAIGSTTEVTLNALQSEKYLKPLTDPADSSIDASGYVLVTKLREGKYDYEPHLSYIENIENTEADQLQAHYTFDDFQEPTTNVVPSPTVFSSGWGSYMNGNDGTFKTEFGTEGLNLINRRSWAGAYKGITLPAAGTYTLSVWVKVISRTQSSVNATLYTSGGGIGDTQATASWSPDKIGVWQKIEMTKTYTTTGLTLYLICYGGTNAAGYEITAQYTMPQIELKSYSTDFVNGSRTGVIKDQSHNANNITLPASTTPRWTKDSKIGEGAYYFNGTSTFIDAGNQGISLLNQGTVSYWVKFDNDKTTEQQLVSINDIQNYYVSTTWYARDNSVGSGASYAIQLRDGNWHHMAYTFSSTAVKLYLDGVLKATSNVAGSQYTSNPVVRFGNYFGGGSYYFKGIMDDVRIYGRVLSDAEIKLNYDIDQAREK